MVDNVFTRSEYRDGIPDELNAGQRWAWVERDLASTYAVGTYSLELSLVMLDEPYTDHTIAAVEADDLYYIEVATADTKDFEPGQYRWAATIVRTSDSERMVVNWGTVVINPDVAASPGIDSVPWEYQVLTAIRATLKGTASEKQSSYSIAGRALSLRTPAELLELEQEFSRRWETKKAEIDRAAGRQGRGRVLVKMSGA